MRINNISPSTNSFKGSKTELTKRIKNAQFTTAPREIKPFVLLSAAIMTPAMLIGSSISRTDNSFQDTIKNNYFNLKINPETNESYEPDKYQLESAKSIYNGYDTLVSAPTGTGKTAIAYYAISKNMQDGKRTFYTTPLKALSNEKYKELKTIFGEENVGITTGDVKENEHAPIVVMTTEIYRNMLFGDKFKEKSKQLDNLKTVIFDELHYLGDVDRGGTWEQSIMMSDKNVQLVSLSATIGNSKDMNNWISRIREKQGNLIDVPSENRHVPLSFDVFSVDGKRQKGSGEKTLQGAYIPEPPENYEYFKVIKNLKEKNKIPAIFFIFSKAESKVLLKELKEKALEENSEFCLNSEEEQKEIQEIIKKYKDEGKYLGEKLNTTALLMGYAIHNSGLLPTQKELVEELFQKKLVKVVLATGTLSAGINMPAKSVIITSSRIPSETSKDPDHRRDMSANEFHQMAGRAGRRGLDTEGFVYAMSTAVSQKKNFQTLWNAKPDKVESQFNPEYSFIASYYGYTQEDETIKELLEKSFHSYDENLKQSEIKAKQLFNDFKAKKTLLQELGYINKDNTLTTKGKILSQLNGYQQLPIIDIIHDKLLTQQSLAALNTAEFTAMVGTMANTTPKYVKPPVQIQIPKNQKKKQGYKQKQIEKNLPFKYGSDTLSNFVNAYTTYLETYNEKMKSTPNFIPIGQNTKVVEHIFDWSDFNSQNPDSRKNWEKMCDKYIKSIAGKTDEGSMFKELTQTVDLLKQMQRITDIGAKLAKEEDEKLYYEELKHKSQEALELILKEPLNEVV